MKKYIVIIILLLASYAFAQDVKVIDMTNDATPTGDDLLYVINDPSGTPGDRKATIKNVIEGGTDGSSTGITRLRLYDGDSNYTQISPGDSAVDLTFTLPTAYPAGTYLVQSTNAGALSTTNQLTGVTVGGLSTTAGTVAVSDSSGNLTSATAVANPYIKIDSTDTVDWWIGEDDTGNELEFRQSATVGTSVKVGFPDTGGLSLYGSTSGTMTFQPTAVAGTTTVTIPAVTGRMSIAAACSALTAGASITLTTGTSNCYTLSQTDNTDGTITFSSGGNAGEEVTIIFTTVGTADEVITFHTTLANSTGTLTLGTTADRYYTIRFISNGSAWFEVSRTGEQS